MKATITPLVLALAMAAPAATAAEDAYRSIMPDGSVRYGESPERGARSVKKIPAPPVTTGTVVATPEEKARSARSETSGPAVSVIPQPPRESPGEAIQGRVQSPKGLPKGAY